MRAEEKSQVAVVKQGPYGFYATARQAHPSRVQ